MEVTDLSARYVQSEVLAEQSDTNIHWAIDTKKID